MSTTKLFVPLLKIFQFPYCREEKKADAQHGFDRREKPPPWVMFLLRVKYKSWSVSNRPHEHSFPLRSRNFNICYLSWGLSQGFEISDCHNQMNFCWMALLLICKNLLIFGHQVKFHHSFGIMGPNKRVCLNIGHMASIQARLWWCRFFFYVVEMTKHVKLFFGKW